MKSKSTTTGYPIRFAAMTAIAGFAAMISSPLHAKSMPATDTTASMSEDQESDLRLSLDKADLAAQSGRTNEAYDIVEKLKAKYPNNPDVLAAESDLGQMRAEQRSVTFSDVCAPVSLNPNSMDLLENSQRLEWNKKGFGCIAYNRRITNQSLEQIESATGQVAIPYAGLALNFDLENDHVNTYDTFTRANGTSQSFYGTRQQGTVMLQKTFDKRNTVGLSVYGNNGEAGAGGQYVLTDRWGGTSFLAHYNQPDWDYVKSIVQNGTKTGVVIERKQYITQNLQATLSAGFEHYALQNLDGAADAPGWNFNLDYAHPIKLSDLGANEDAWYNDELTLGAHYGVEAEYFTFVDHRFDRDGDPYHPLPATSYEVHSFTVSAGKSFLQNFDAEIDGGYGVNRWTGGNGPLYGASLTWTPLQHLGIDIHASRTLLGGQNMVVKKISPAQV